MEISAGGSVFKVEVIPDKTSVKEYICSKVKSREGEPNSDDPFYVVDVGQVIDFYDMWTSALPNVEVFYAVKCNSNPLLLKVLAATIQGFDCASKNEIDYILDLGVSPDRIIYANPCKQISHLKYAAEKRVRLMTFDCESELLKVKAYFPDARLVLRVLPPDDPEDVVSMGVKFGCTVANGRKLLDLAKSLDLDVVGISFHVGIGHDGSGRESPYTYQASLKMSAELFQYAAEIGYRFTLLDIGGGYPGHRDCGPLFRILAKGISEGLEQFSSSVEHDPNLKIIAEPGRFLARSTHTLALCIHSKKKAADDSVMYLTSDGRFGSFGMLNFIPNYNFKPLLLKEHQSSVVLPSSLWGPCCAPDKFCTAPLPELNIGDWVYFEDMGSYSVSMGSSFNGFPLPPSYYYISETHRATVEQHLGVFKTSLSTPLVPWANKSPSHQNIRPVYSAE